MIKLTLSAIFLGLVAVSAQAQNAPRNELSTGISYSSQNGAVGMIGFDGRDLMGSGIDLSLNFRKGKAGSDGTGRLRYSRDISWDRLGYDAQLVFGAEVTATDWSSQAYTSGSQTLSVALQASLTENLSYSAKLFWKNNKLSGLGASASPLVIAEQGKSSSAGLAFDGHYGRLEGGVLPVSGLALDTGFVWAGLGQRKTLSTYAAVTFAQPIQAQNAIVLRAEGGFIHGLNGQSVSILDRAFLGGSGGPRGFGFGGIGPRDFVSGAVNTPLGGRRYLTASVEVRRDISEKLSLGGFLDGGAVWDLGNVPMVGAMGTIDDSRRFRTSVGVAIYYETPLGKLNINLAKPIDFQRNDSFDRLSVGLMLTKDR